MKSIILLSGPVGAGKTAVGQELVASSQDPLVYIEGDKFWSFLAKPDMTMRIERTFKMTLTAMTAAALPYALNGYQTIVDFSIPPWFLETALRMTSARQIPLDFVMLLPPIDICAARAASREEGRIQDYTRYRELYETFTGMESHAVRDCERSPLEMADQIREMLSAGRFRVSTPV